MLIFFAFIYLTITFFGIISTPPYVAGTKRDCWSLLTLGFFKRNEFYEQALLSDKILYSVFTRKYKI